MSSRFARWNCKVCKSWGVGGAIGWLAHWNREHVHNARYGAHIAFGFTGQYADGYERRYDRTITPAVAKEAQP